LIHHVFANRSNIGDWLSARGIQSLLAPLPITEYLCDDPFVAETLDRLRAAGPGDLIVIGGGGLFMDYFEPFWEGLLRLKTPAPIIIWGVGYCDLKRVNSRPRSELDRNAAKLARFCFVRDELSRKLLDLPNLPPPSACPSLCAVPPATEPGHGLLHVDNYDTAGADIYEAMDAVAEKFADRTGRLLRKTNNRIEPGKESDVVEILRRYTKSDLVVSSALHGCILSVAMGKRVLAVSGDRKIEGFMEQVGLLDWVLSIDELDRFGEMLERLHEQPPVRDRTDALRRVQATIAGEVRALVEKRGRA
jgi:polysaccharide pyruvyl transferase WcaK-like protein